MANAQAAEEELQQSVVLSEEDAEYEEDDAHDAMDVDSGSTRDQAVEVNETRIISQDNEDDEAEEIIPDTEATKAGDEGYNQIADPDIERLGHSSGADEESNSQGSSVRDEDEVFADGGEGDEEEGNPNEPVNEQGVPSSDEEEDEEAEAEGVGAVKIKPGETDEDDSESEDNASLASDASDGESNDEWEVEAEIEDEEDEESEIAESSLCLFCKKDEEHDPGEDLESFLACKGCGEHAHQHCARAADSISNKNGGATWKCPECLADDKESDSESQSSNDDVELNGEVDDGDISPASTRRSTASRITRDLLPSQRGINKPDSHSVFNQLVLDEDPMDGSRVLRKRKTSSAEADIDEDIISLPKRRRNTLDNDPAQEESDHDTGTNGIDESVRPRSARSLRLKISNAAPRCTIVKKSRMTLLLKLRVSAAELQQILSKNPKPRKRAERAERSIVTHPARPTASRATATGVVEPTMAPFMPSSYTQPFYSFYDKETDELKGKPYGGILTEAEADTSKTLPTKDDRRRFDEAKQKADEEWRNRLLKMQDEIEMPLKKSRKASAGPASQIECIEFGGWEIDTWYAAPYPEEYSRNRVLYICEFCLKYMNSDYVAWRHKLKCPAKHPPGDEIYRYGSVSFFEVDGRKNPVYCQNLCLLAKLFLGSKTLYYDVEPFLFYVLCEYDDMGYHFVGYFSKEKRASSQNNVSCILTLPIHQRKGYGNLLIDFSYLLTRAEEKTGSPEKPLSDMGLVSYRNYWRLILCKYLVGHTPEDKVQRKGLSIRQISDDTGMMPDDVISALEGLRCLVRDPETKLYAFRVDLPFCREYVAKWESKNYVKLNDKCLTWTPYVMGRSNASNFELGPALNAIAPREEDEENKAVQVLAASGIAPGDFAEVAEANPGALVETATIILESTEPNENAMADTQADDKVNGVDKENEQPQIEEDSQDATEAVAPPQNEDDWQTLYSSIPVVRFEVFPPANPKRPGPPRLGSNIMRPVIRTPATAPRPRVRRSVGTTRKSASRSSGSTRKKSGGTGRGPGRWPKGTKKSDYGNADSGPGLPPSWLQRQRQASVVDVQAQETVQVRQGNEAKAVENMAISTGTEVSDDNDQSSESDDNEELKELDVVMDEVEDEDEDEDEDAEGEDEDAEGEDE